VPTVSYTRGTDLRGTLEGAGGIGGLLARTDHSIFSIQPSEAHAYYHCDANGNVIVLIDAHQNVVARYAYEPFGRVFYMSGTLAEANVYRFSSKEADPSGLVYYLYRYYEPAMQRWVNRDPIHEAGGWNLYGFVQNNPVSNYDPFGLVRGSGPDPYCTGKCAKQLTADLIGCSLYMIAGGAIFILLPPTGPLAGHLMGMAATCAVLAAARYAMCIRSCVLTAQCPFPIGPYPGSWPWKMP
jgi:RHS repeat-associated protein